MPVKRLKNEMEKRFPSYSIYLDKFPNYSNEYIFDYYFTDLNDLSSKGYVIYTFECVVHCLLTTDNYEDAVLKAVNLGGDTDTNAAICGGLAGIYYGFESIPIDWRKTISKIDTVLSLCENYEAFCDES